jgi:hypothetical protein
MYDHPRGLVDRIDALRFRHGCLIAKIGYPVSACSHSERTRLRLKR